MASTKLDLPLNKKSNTKDMGEFPPKGERTIEIRSKLKDWGSPKNAGEGFK